MWKIINTEQSLSDFLATYNDFHDCCLKELRYISGAFVNKDLIMHPTNDIRKLCIIFQRQCDSVGVVEMEFLGLYKLNLKPISPLYTCELLDVVMFFEENKIFWADSSLFKTERELYDGTWLCADCVKWRVVEENIGSEEIYG